MRLKHVPEAEGIVKRSAYYVPEPAAQKGQWNASFSNENPIYIEIGTGKGQFIVGHAAEHPDRNYIGIERYESVLYKAVKKVEALKTPLANLRFLCEDAAELSDWFAPGEVARIYLNFSDPWPKARHEKRRLTSPRFRERYERVLARDGLVEFKTDNRELFDYSLETFREAAGWSVEAVTYDLHDDPMLSFGNIMTEYEEKFSEKGQKIGKLVVRWGG